MSTSVSPIVPGVELPQEANSTVTDAVLSDAEWVAHRGPSYFQQGLDFLDNAPAAIDAYLPAPVKAVGFFHLYMAGIGLGVVRSVAKAVYCLPGAIDKTLSGEVGLGDVAGGLKAMVVEDAKKLWHVPGQVLDGYVFSAGSNVGDVAFDVGTTIEGGTSVIKAMKVLGEVGGKLAETAILHTQTTLAAAGEAIALGGMRPAYATVLVDSAEISIPTALAEVPRPNEGLSLAMSGRKDLWESVADDGHSLTDNTVSESTSRGVVAARMAELIPATISDLCDAMKRAGVPEEIAYEFTLTTPQQAEHLKPLHPPATLRSKGKVFRVAYAMVNRVRDAGKTIRYPRVVIWPVK